MVGRNVLVVVLFVLLVLILNNQNSVLASASEASRSVSSRNYASSTLTWAPLKMRDRSIIAVGARRLPIPIVLPRGLLPASGKAVLVTLSRPFQNSFGIYVFFNPSQERQVQAWASQLPANFPLPKGIYQLKHPPVHVGMQGPVTMWTYDEIAYTRWGIIGFIWEGGDRPTARDPNGHTDIWKFINSCKDSLMKGQSHYVWMSIHIMYNSH